MISDVLIRRGRVIDPSQQLDAVLDVAIRDGTITAIGEDLTVRDAAMTIDAQGLYVVPGLIDLHVHVYRGHSPFGLEPDPLCAAGGVTTMLDAGSAGSHNFSGFRRDVIDPADTEIFALVNLSCIGLAAFTIGELPDRRYADPEGVVRVLTEHPEVAIGVKLRASEHIIGSGATAWANLHDALSAARESGTWLMIHIADTPMPLPEILTHLEPGDCITHCFTRRGHGLLDEKGRVFQAVRDAQQRGVVFDVGHGFGSFSWDVAEAAIAQGFEPTTISTDLHTLNVDGPVYDMPTTMSKFLALGVPLARVVEMSTSRPAAVLKRSGQLGTLREGTVADVTVLRERSGKFALVDTDGKTRTGERLLEAVSTIRRGALVGE